MSGYTKQVEITKTVPVADVETLEAWLDKELEEYIISQQSSTGNFTHAGRRVLALIKEAGFALKPPVATRS